MQLTSHFSLDELTHSNKAYELGIDNYPSPDEVINLGRLANKLEEVRAILNKPIHITSGYRCLELNRAIGSSDTSQHVKGCAADFQVNGLTPSEIIGLIIRNNMEFDQIIEEHLGGKSWVHISVPDRGKKARKQALTIDERGTRSFK